VHLGPIRQHHNFRRRKVPDFHECRAVSVLHRNLLSNRMRAGISASDSMILDVSKVRIGELAGGTVMSAQEMSKINCLSGIALYGSVGYVAQAGGMSTISLSCALASRSTAASATLPRQAGCRRLALAAHSLSRARHRSTRSRLRYKGP
jgi:hypothetical protein